MNGAVVAFFNKHNFILNQDVDILANAILDDMNEGLLGRDAGQDMIKTFSVPPSKQITNSNVIVIDKFAENLEHLKDKSTNIGFCFSYPMTITEDGDGILLGFSKEVKAPEVVGSHIGAELALSLKAHGWKNNIKISLLNDTVAALLAGAADNPIGKNYSSYLGLILGTGMNCAYIQPETPLYKGLARQIIVCESGKFAKVTRSDFDIEYDLKSIKPGSSLLEKQCSGAYLGPVSLEIIKQACKEGLFSKAFSASLLSIESLTLIEMDSFLHTPYNTKSILAAKAKECATEEDYEKLYQLLDAVVDRCARIAASILTACAIKSGEGKVSYRPLSILCNGTTFYKTWKVKDRVISYLEESLTRKRGIYYEIVSKDNDITLGTAIAGLMK